MSNVTDVVFTAKRYEDATEFQDQVERHQGDRPEPILSGGRATGVYVFHLGVNYMEQELRAWLESPDRVTASSGFTMLYLHGEDDETPTVIVPGHRTIATECRYT
jgi:hypothetical protein